MRVLVTGGAGFIGSHTVDCLLRNGYAVRILDSLESPVHPQRKKPSYIPNDAEFILGDVRVRSDLQKALKGVDFVFHLAAHQGYLKDFSNFAGVNDFSAALLYEIIVNECLPIKKVILASSQAVYGEGKYSCAAHGIRYPLPRSLEQLETSKWEIKCSICGGKLTPLPADEPMVNPHNQYAVSKYAQELYALTLGKRYGIPTVALRYSITQGPRQSFYNAYSGILRTFSLRLINGIPPVIYEDGKQLRDYVSVYDVVSANMLVLEKEATNYEVFNVGGSGSTTVMEYTTLLADILGKHITPDVSGTFRFGDTRHIISDISKLRSIGWKPVVPLEQMISGYLDWVKQYNETADHYAQAEKVMRQQGVIKSSR